MVCRGLILVSISVLLWGSSILSAETPQEKVAPKEESAFGADLVILLSADLRGETDPCGCKVTPRGGLAKKANILSQIKVEGVPTLFLDAGNSLFSETKLDPRFQSKEAIQAGAVAQSHVAMGIGAMGVGPHDFALGAEFLLGLKDRTHVPFVVTNLIDGKTGAPIFLTAPVIQVGPRRVLVLNALYPGAEVTSKQYTQLEITEPVEAIKKAIAGVQPPADLVVLFSSMDEAANRKVLEANPEIRVLASNQSGAGNQGILGQAVTLNVVPKGKFVARLDIDLDQPWLLQSDKERFGLEQRLDSLGKTLVTYRNQGDPEVIHKNNASVLQFYRKYTAQEKALQEQLDALGPPPPSPYRYRQIDVPKEQTDDPAVLAIVDKAKAEIKNVPAQ